MSEISGICLFLVTRLNSAKSYELQYKEMKVNADYKKSFPYAIGGCHP